MTLEEHDAAPDAVMRGASRPVAGPWQVVLPFSDEFDPDISDVAALFVEAMRDWERARADGPGVIDLRSGPPVPDRSVRLSDLRLRDVRNLVNDIEGTE